MSSDREDLLARIQALERALVEAEETNRALVSGQVDAIVDRSGSRALLLHEAQAALQRSEERYRTIVTTAEEGVWTVDPAFITTFANQRLASMLGYEVEEMIGRPADEFIDAAGREAMRERFERHTRAGDRVRTDVPYRRKDGTLLWTSVGASPLVDPDGRFAGSLAMLTDITERRMAEEENRRSEERFKMIFQSSPAAIGIGDGGTIVDGNGRYCEFYGYDRAELIGRNVLELGLWVELADRDRMLAMVREAGSVRDFETSFRRKSGEVRDALLYVEILDGRAGGEPVLLIMVVDTTERKRAVLNLRESAERYRVLFDDNPMPMWAFDQETLAIVAANEAAARQYGYTTRELTSKSLLDIEPSLESEKTAESVRKPEQGRVSDGPRKHRRKDGTLLDVDVHANDVELKGRRLRLAVLHDVTKRQALEDQLRQSQKMEAVGRLAGGVAHDFNNLLTAILGYSDLLDVRFKTGDSGREEIGEIRRAAERAASLTRQLLAFSRKQVLVPEVLDIGEVVRGLSGLLGRLIGEDIRIDVVIAPDLGLVEADPGQMEQVVMNIAVNARDAMPEGGKLLFEVRNVELSAADAGGSEDVPPGSYVMIAITDSGIGMTPEIRKGIFEPFFTTKEPGKGTGLGLSMVHGIVHQSGGAIRVYSEPGHGTTFRIYLPRVAVPRKAALPTPGISPAPSRGGSESILLVEDEEPLRRLAKRILDLAGYTVLEARDPEDAKRIARTHDGPIHLLLTDVVMPGSSGPELAASLTKELPQMRVLFMSGYTDDAIVHHGILNPGSHFLSKPFAPHQLVKRVREVLARDVA